MVSDPCEYYFCKYLLNTSSFSTFFPHMYGSVSGLCYIALCIILCNIFNKCLPLREVNNKYYFEEVISFNTHYCFSKKLFYSWYLPFSMMYKMTFQVYATSIQPAFAVILALTMFFNECNLIKIQLLKRQILSSLTYVHICEPFTAININIFINQKVSWCHFVSHSSSYTWPRWSWICFLSVNISLHLIEFYISVPTRYVLYFA